MREMCEERGKRCEKKRQREMQATINMLKERDAKTVMQERYKERNAKKFFGMYVDNPSVIKMLIMVDDNDLIMGRALLWNIDDNKVMDRIYTTNDEEFQYHFKKWAITNGYIYKHEQKWNNTLMFESNGEKIEKQLQIKLNSFKYDKYPYLDTFKFFDRNSGVIYNYLPENDSIKTICAPDGSILPGDYLMQDFKTNLFQHRGEMVPIYYLDGTINKSSRFFTHSPNTDFSRVNNLYILKDDSKYSEEIDDFIFNEELDHLNDKEGMEIIRRKILEREERRQKEKEKMDALISHQLEEFEDNMVDQITRSATFRRIRQIYTHDVETILQDDTIDIDSPPSLHPVDRTEPGFFG